MQEWIFYSIYVPSISYLEDAVEKVVLPTVNKVKEEYLVHNWFFIRYIDMQGPHIRLRFKVDSEVVTEIEEVLEVVLEERLEKLLQSTPKDIKRLIPIQAEDKEYEAIFQQEEYEPEYEKYGGIEGVEIAERCFDSSSDLVLNYVESDSITEKDRFELALILMKLTVEKSNLPMEEENWLWEEMLNHWSGANYDKDSKLKMNLTTAANKRKEIAHKSIQSLSKQSKVKDVIRDYGNQLSLSFDKLKNMETVIVPMKSLVFHYIHMMNNRLGVWPLEEAYLGALLLQINSEIDLTKINNQKEKGSVSS